MDFLAIVRDVARQSGTLAGGTTISSIAGVTGRAEKIVDWVQKAWEDIQTARDDWRWMYREFDSALLVDTKRYTAASFNLTSFTRWLQDRYDESGSWVQPFTLYDPDRGQADEQAIGFIPYQAWRQRYDRGSHDAQRPVCYTISPVGELCFGPTPDKAYVLRGEYVKGAQTLADNTDTPEMPARFHTLIVWRAMVYMGNSDESGPTVAAANAEYQKLFRKLCSDQLPSLSLEGNVLA